MMKQPEGAVETLRRKTPMQRFLLHFRNNWQLHLMMLLPLAYLLLFEFGPMYGLQIAFKDYRPRRGIWGSEWVGIKHFQTFFANYKWKQIVLNTVKISLYSIVAGFPIPIILALILHINEKSVLKKIAQNCSYIPHFISTVVMVGILNQIFNPFSGLWAALQKVLGLQIYSDIRANPDAFIHLYVWSGVWQSMGWSTIMYVAALTSVSQELHEAAKIDGASRWRRVFAVDLPAIMPTVCIMLIMRFGNILAVGRDKVYLMQNTMNLSVSEVISTYVYKRGLAENQFSFGTAVSLMNSAINTVMLLLVNWVTNRLSDGEQGLF